MPWRRRGARAASGRPSTERHWRPSRSYRRDLITVGVDSLLARRAGKHGEQLGLRGYDSVHLATALELDDEESRRSDLG
jgi:hypothetical protein